MAMEVRVIPFEEIEQRFRLVPLRLGLAVYPAVVRQPLGYSIRVLTGRGFITEGYDYFKLDAEGNITEAPRGHARDYCPGRIPVEELEAAVQRYGRR